MASSLESTLSLVTPNMVYLSKEYTRCIAKAQARGADWKKNVKIEKVEREVNQLAVTHMKRLLKNKDLRLKLFEETKEVKWIKEGIYYPIEYSNILKKLDTDKAKEQWQWFAKRHAFYMGHTSPKHFDRVKDSSAIAGYQHMRFILKEGVVPTEALEALENSLTLVGCGEVTQIAYYNALRTLGGDTVFNDFFTKNPLEIQYNNPENPLMKLCRHVKYDETGPLQPQFGNILYFNTFPSTTLSALFKRKMIPELEINPYSIRQPAGAAGAFNVIVDEEGKLFGAGLSVEGISEEGLKRYLHSEFTTPEEKITKTSEHYLEPLATIVTNRATLPPVVFEDADKKAKVCRNYEVFLRAGGAQKGFFVFFDGKRVLDYL